MRWQDHTTLHHGDFAEALSLCDGAADLPEPFPRCVLPRVNPSMARRAEKRDVVRGETKIWKLGPPLDVVKMKRARVLHPGFRVCRSASLAEVSLSCVDRPNDDGPLCAGVDPLALWGRAALPVWMKRPTKPVHRVPASAKIGPRVAGSLAHLLFRLVCVIPPPPRAQDRCVAVCGDPVPLRTPRDSKVNELSMDALWVAPYDATDSIGGKPFIKVLACEPFTI